MATVTFDNHDLTADFIIGELTREYLMKEVEQIAVPGRDGAMFASAFLTPVKISMTVTYASNDPSERSDALRNLAGILNVYSPKKLAISDDGGKYYLAVPSGGDITRFVGAESFQLTFTALDPAMYGAARSATVPSGGSAEITVGGNYKTMPSIEGMVTVDSETALWTMGFDGEPFSIQKAGTSTKGGSGTSIEVGDALALTSLTVHGESVQEGTPSPSSPARIRSVSGGNLYNPVGSYGRQMRCTAAASGDIITVNATGGDAYVGASGSVGTAWAENVFGQKMGVAAGETYHLIIGNSIFDKNYITAFGTDGKVIASQLINSASGSMTMPSGAAFATIRFGSENTVASESYQTTVSFGKGQEYLPYGCIGIVAGTDRTPIDLQGESLRSLPDGTHDELAVDAEGNVTLTKRVAHVEVNDQSQGISANAVTVSGTPMTLFRIQLSANGFPAFHYDGGESQWNVLSNQYRTNGGNVRFDGWTNLNHSVFTTSDVVGAIDVVTTLWSTVADFKAALASNPLYVDYRLATPQTIELDSISMPYVDGTLWVDAEVTPTIDAEWLSPKSGELEADSATRTVTFGGESTIPTLDSDWPVLEPGTHTVSNTSGSGASTVTWIERWV